MGSVKEAGTLRPAGISGLQAGEDVKPPDNTPLSQLVLWVPPAIAAGWEHLEPAQQTALTQELAAWLTSRLLPPPPPDPTLEERIRAMSVTELRAFVENLERKFGLQKEPPA